MTFKTNALRAVLAAGLLASPAMAVSAVAQEAQPAPQATPAPAAPVDDAKLKSFALAYLEVNKVAETYRPRLEAAKNQEEQQQIQQEATQGMAQAVEASDGITVEEYNQIVGAAQADPELAQRINTHLREAAGAAPAGTAPAESAPAESAPAQ